MRWGSASSDAASLTRAIGHAAEQVAESLDGEQPHLVLVFVSHHYAPSYYSVPELLRVHFPDAVILGCSGGGVIGGGREIERRPGVALAGAVLDGVDLTPFHIENTVLPDADASPDEWATLIGVPAADNPSLLMFSDPLSFETDRLISGLDFAFPDSPKLGGLASGGNMTMPHALFLNHRVFRRGAVGLALTGDIEITPLVAQGCKPIGKPMVVTECDEHMIKRLGDQTPLQVLQGLFQESDSRDRWLIRRALRVGVVMDPLADHFSAGDFLIRNVLGLDQTTGALGVADPLQEGEVIQFHVRDAQAAREDAGAVLESYASTPDRPDPVAGLLFSCVGRGQKLFGEPDHDSRMFGSLVAPVPLTGFFSNGEIGPVGGVTFLHGYTSAFAIVSRKNRR